jgi:Flp pilus assembly protein CpaB
MFRSLRRPFPRIGRWPRFLLAGTCVLLALSSALGAKRGALPQSPTAAVVVAARSLPAGHLLMRDDLAVARWPATMGPTSARGDPTLVVGKRLAGPVAAGEAITTTRILGAHLTDGLGARFVAAPVVLGDPHAADLVRAGDRVDLLEAARPPDIVDPAQTADPTIDTVASDALVLAVLPARADADAELVLAVRRSTAVRITRDTASHVFTAVVNPP